MTKKATVFLKHMISLLSSVGKAKFLAIKSKARAPLMMLSAMKMSREVRSILGRHPLHQHPSHDSGDRRFILYGDKECQTEKQLGHVEDGGADEEDEVESSVADHRPSLSSLTEIDEAADLFIIKFRNQIRLQKLESFKSMVEREALDSP